ncbi:MULTISPECIES: Ig-like domain-containing protein [unclassified Microbacterium]|uniref:Ig-like domain-containing protein n=1 Tax=unclassified Microbacterium TaxID=2609290 RepID=UPI0004939481|nr:MULTISPECIES: Ig-like domain-containing protein [unclassified Microbacterium]
MSAGRAFGAIGAVSLLAFAFAFASPPRQASAAEIGDVFTSITISPVLGTPWQQTSDPTSIPDGSLVDVSFAFTLPDEATAGDTATMTFRSSGGVTTSVADLAPFPILSADGETIAIGTGAGDTVTVTFAAYVDTHTAVSGSGTFQARVSASAAAATPSAFGIPIAVSSGEFPATVRIYRITDVSTEAVGVHGTVLDDTSLEWRYFSAIPLYNLDLALMDGASVVDCAALHLEYRDAAWTPGDPYPSDAQFGAPVGIPTASCTPVSGGLDSATQVVSVVPEAQVPAGTLREFRLIAGITSDEQPEFQAVLATSDAGSTQTVSFVGFAERQTARGVGQGTLIPLPPEPDPDTSDGGTSQADTLADSGLSPSALPGLGVVLVTLGVLAITGSRRFRHLERQQ